VQGVVNSGLPVPVGGSIIDLITVLLFIGVAATGLKRKTGSTPA
jgi:hypothetical protein